MKLSIDLNQTGFDLVLKDYQRLCMQTLWETKQGQSSRDVYDEVNKRLKKEGGDRKDISRASIINFLNDMVDDEILDYTETTGKGGHHRVYYAGLTETQFWDRIARETEKLLNDASGRDLFGKA